jgi:hypothetical protein
MVATSRRSFCDFALIVTSCSTQRWTPARRRSISGPDLPHTGSVAGGGTAVILARQAHCRDREGDSGRTDHLTTERAGRKSERDSRSRGGTGGKAKDLSETATAQVVEAQQKLEALDKATTEATATLKKLEEEEEFRGLVIPNRRAPPSSPHRALPCSLPLSGPRGIIIGTLRGREACLVRRECS